MMGRGRDIALAVDILSGLPHFGAATLAEIIDIRRELEKPLKRFRKAMLGYSDRIACAPWEEAFNAETDRIFIRKIEPAVLELEEAAEMENLHVYNEPAHHHRLHGQRCGRPLHSERYARHHALGSDQGVLEGRRWQLA
jgi:hypothetical protein